MRSAATTRRTRRGPTASRRSRIARRGSRRTARPRAPGQDRPPGRGRPRSRTAGWRTRGPKRPPTHRSRRRAPRARRPLRCARARALLCSLTRPAHSSAVGGRPSSAAKASRFLLFCDARCAMSASFISSSRDSRLTLAAAAVTGRFSALAENANASETAAKDRCICDGSVREPRRLLCYLSPVPKTGQSPESSGDALSSDLKQSRFGPGRGDEISKSDLPSRPRNAHWHVGGAAEASE